MSPIRFVNDPQFVIPLPSEVLDDAARAAWARDAVAATARVHGADVVRAEQAEELASRMQAMMAGDGVTGALLFAPAWRIWTAVRIAVTDVEPTDEEIDDYLRPPAPMPPQVRLTQELPIGVGVSSTVLLSRDPALGAVRWLFVPRDRGIRVETTPVAAPAVTAIAALTEVFLSTVRIDGIDGVRSDRFDPDRLARPLDVDGRRWSE